MTDTALQPGDRVCVPGRFHDLVVREVRSGLVFADFRRGYGGVSMPPHNFVRIPPCAWCVEKDNLP